MDKKSQIIITCEHGGNKIPQQFKKLFVNNANALATHLGYDIGALEMAKKIVRKLKCPFVFETISRLLVEQNRSRYRKEVFSEFCSNLTIVEKERLLETIYDSYHDRIYKHLSTANIKKNFVYHFSIHSFTPVLFNRERNADLGLLYDPSRKIEKRTAALIAEKLTGTNTGLRVRMNYPYRGASDGFTTTLRKQYREDEYCGIEIELNQKHFIGKTEIWDSLLKHLPEVISKF